MMPQSHSVLIYDAACVLCSRSANFVAKRDHEGRFWFADTASKAGRELMAAHGIEPEGIDAVVLIEGSRAYIGSSAALKILGRLGLPWRLFETLLVVPAFVREPLYRFVARNRHRIFRPSQCPLPDPDLTERML